MNSPSRFWSDAMVWLLVAWVCSLPFVALIVVPLLGKEWVRKWAWLRLWACSSLCWSSAGAGVAGNVTDENSISFQ